MNPPTLFLLLAQEAAEKNYGWSWAVILLSLFLGLAAALNPPKRTAEVRKAKVED